MSEPDEIFRQEALEHHRRQSAPGGELVRLDPRWLSRTYWVVLALFGVGLVFLVFGRVGEYATGPAIVRAEGRLELIATAEGNVERVQAVPGQRVVEGEVLVRLDAQGQHDELVRLDREIQLQTVKALQDPGDRAARQALTPLRAEREKAAARLEARTVRATRAGVVSDVRIRAGMRLQAGDTVMTLTPDDARFSVIALVPGEFRPHLVPGGVLRLELDGQPFQYHELAVDRVANEVIGPAEARRYLGSQLNDAVELRGPLVVLQARLQGTGVVYDGKTLPLHDGLVGTAHARVRTQSMLTSLAPWVRVFKTE